MWETSTVDSDAAKNINNFIQIGTFSPENGASSWNDTIDVAFTTQESGVYFAFVDRGTCVFIQHVFVYYDGIVCPGNKTDLIEHFEVLAPQPGVIGTCAPNSYPLNESVPVLNCTDDGNWEVVSPCLCGPGYEPQIISNSMFCIGEYKSSPLYYTN